MYVILIIALIHFSYLLKCFSSVTLSSRSTSMSWYNVGFVGIIFLRYELYPSTLLLVLEPPLSDTACWFHRNMGYLTRT